MMLALINSGTFLMGSPDSGEGAVHEKPQHHVAIVNPFYLGVYPVTQGEYEEVIGNDPSLITANSRRPVENVTWFDAIAFCNRLSEIKNAQPYYLLEGRQVSIAGGNGYRLPTEAEWEYACRCGTSTKWSFGDDESQLKQYAWYDRISDNTKHPVGRKKPNSWGLHDMYGNVEEWCWDLYDRDYYKNSIPNDPMGPTTGLGRIIRGGSFAQAAYFTGSSHRDYHRPTYRGRTIGFRLARTSPLAPV